MKKLTDFRKTVGLRFDYVSLLAVISNSPCKYWSSSQHEWWNNLAFNVFFFFLFFLGDAQFPRLSMGKILLCIYLWSVCELCTTATNMLRVD